MNEAKLPKSDPQIDLPGMWTDQKDLDFQNSVVAKEIMLPKERWRVKLYQLN